MYYYKVQGCNSIGCAGESEVEDLSVPSMPPSGSSSQVRADLSGSSRDGDTSSAVTIVWNAVSGIDSYIVEHNTDAFKGFEFEAIATVDGAAITMHTIDGLDANDFHYYQVQACNRFGDALFCGGKFNHQLILGGLLIGDGTTAAPENFSATACRGIRDFARVRWTTLTSTYRLYKSRFPIDKGAAESTFRNSTNTESGGSITRNDDGNNSDGFGARSIYYQIQACDNSATTTGDCGIPARANTSPSSPLPSLSATGCPAP